MFDLTSLRQISQETGNFVRRQADVVLQPLAIALRDLIGGNQDADHPRHPATAVIHRVDNRRDAVAEERLANHITSGFILLYHLPQRFAIVQLARSVARQSLVREQLFKLAA